MGTATTTIATKVVLPGYEAQPSVSGVDHSRRKLQEAARDLKSFVDNISVAPCQREEETFGYRCICTFQLVLEHNRYQYAMRHKNEPIVLGTAAFPIATKRIQQAMTLLLDLLNEDVTQVLAAGTTSVTFASSWIDTSTCDCIVTLLYGQPVDEEAWKESAQLACHALSLTRLIGRSRGRLFCVSGCKDHGYLEDTLYLCQSSTCALRVKLLLEDGDAKHGCIPVLYQKPETAFFHPNSRAMVKALEWLMDRLQNIGKASAMLELYCGCGAHTVALAKSGFVGSIVAVELDTRLVQACVTNCRLNGCHGDERQAPISPVYVVQGDASEWANTYFRNSSSKEFDILLVDPPRMGLGENICQLATQGSFQHILYISCGRHALKRDLERLNATFEVANCHLLDLFPRTDSVESLVHLKRRQASF
jgi:tRNA/tmRNA/rRNA uracil-C5-methylase (TrmA/RlmC/RlmD family)